MTMHWTDQLSVTLTTDDLPTYHKPRHGYHVTERFRLGSIMSAGLVPHIGPRSTALGETRMQTYLFPHGTSVLDACGSWLVDAFDEHHDLALLEVDLNGISVRRDLDWEVVADTVIPAHRIRLLGLLD